MQQVHLQTLPSLLLQTCLIYQHHGLINIGVPGVIAISLAMTQLLISGLTISVTSLVLSTPLTTPLSPSSPTPTAWSPASLAKIDEEAPPPLPARNLADARWNMAGLCQVGPGTGSNYAAHATSAIRSGRYQMAIATIRSVGLLFSRTVAVGVFMVIIQLNLNSSYQIKESLQFNLVFK